MSSGGVGGGWSLRSPWRAPSWTQMVRKLASQTLHHTCMADVCLCLASLFSSPSAALVCVCVCVCVCVRERGVGGDMRGYDTPLLLYSHQGFIIMCRGVCVCVCVCV